MKMGHNLHVGIGMARMRSSDWRRYSTVFAFGGCSCDGADAAIAYLFTAVVKTELQRSNGEIADTERHGM